MVHPLKKGNQATLLRPQQMILPYELGKYLELDAALIGRLGWERFVAGSQMHGDLTYLEGLDHLARRLFCQYRYHGTPVVLLGE